MGRNVSSIPAHHFCPATGCPGMDWQVGLGEKWEQCFVDADGFLSCSRPVGVAIPRPSFREFSFHARKGTNTHQSHHAKPRQIIAITFFLPPSGVTRFADASGPIQFHPPFECLDDFIVSKVFPSDFHNGGLATFVFPERGSFRFKLWIFSPSSQRGFSPARIRIVRFCGRISILLGILHGLFEQYFRRDDVTRMFERHDPAGFNHAANTRSVFSFNTRERLPRRGKSICDSWRVRTRSFRRFDIFNKETQQEHFSRVTDGLNLFKIPPQLCVKLLPCFSCGKVLPCSTDKGGLARILPITTGDQFIVRHGVEVPFVFRKSFCGCV